MERKREGERKSERERDLGVSDTYSVLFSARDFFLVGKMLHFTTRSHEGKQYIDCVQSEWLVSSTVFSLCRLMIMNNISHGQTSTLQSRVWIV